MSSLVGNETYLNLFMRLKSKGLAITANTVHIIYVCIWITAISICIYQKLSSLAICVFFLIINSSFSFKFNEMHVAVLILKLDYEDCFSWLYICKLRSIGFRGEFKQNPFNLSLHFNLSILNHFDPFYIETTYE